MSLHHLLPHTLRRSRWPTAETSRSESLFAYAVTVRLRFTAGRVRLTDFRGRLTFSKKKKNTTMMNVPKSAIDSMRKRQEFLTKNEKAIGVDSFKVF